MQQQGQQKFLQIAINPYQRINFINGWGLIRASNTTPKLVLRFEADTVEEMVDIKNLFLSELSRICPDIVINLD